MVSNCKELIVQLIHQKLIANQELKCGAILKSCKPATTICPRRLAQMYILTYCIEWAKTSWTYSTLRQRTLKLE